MINLSLTFITILVTIIHIIIKRKELDSSKMSNLVLNYFLIMIVFISSLISFIGHTFFGEYIAPKIGWLPSPFEIEVGLNDGSWGLLAILAVFVRGTFVHALIIGWSFFMISAGINHFIEMSNNNLAEYNVLMSFFDIGLSLIGISIWIWWMKANNVRFIKTK